MEAGGVSPPGNPRHRTGFALPTKQQKPKLLDYLYEPLVTTTRGPPHQERSFCTEDEAEGCRRHERNGRPLGHEHFVLAVERKLGRTLRRGRPGPKRSRGADIEYGVPGIHMLRGQIVGDTIVAYCTPRHQGENIAGTVTLRIIETGSTLSGKSTGLEPTRSGVFSADNQWRRRIFGDTIRSL
jgi:hypothetical protein